MAFKYKRRGIDAYFALLEKAFSECESFIKRRAKQGTTANEIKATDAYVSGFLRACQLYDQEIERAEGIK